MTQQERDDYLAAYAAWRVATDAFEDKMRRALKGEAVDATQLALDATVLKRPHIDWLEKPLPLTTFKRSQWLWMTRPLSKPASLLALQRDGL